MLPKPQGSGGEYGTRLMVAGALILLTVVTIMARVASLEDASTIFVTLLIIGLVDGCIRSNKNPHPRPTDIGCQAAKHTRHRRPRSRIPLPISRRPAAHESAPELRLVGTATKPKRQMSRGRIKLPAVQPPGQPQSVPPEEHAAPR